MKKVILTMFVLCTSILISVGQEVTVTEKGSGTDRTSALTDARRNAVAQAFGVTIKSETKVENAVAVKDVISTRTDGYIKSEEVIDEKTDKGITTITIKAVVTTSSMKADNKTMSQMLGGLRFLVIYDGRKLEGDEKNYFDFGLERINEKLGDLKYRYAESQMMSKLRNQAELTLKADTSETTFIQKLGFWANAEFVILINEIDTQTEEKDGVFNAKAKIKAKIYDNCTAEGLGTVVMEGDWVILANEKAAIERSISTCVQKNFVRLNMQFSQYIGEWLNNGAPFELRFFGPAEELTNRKMIPLKNKMKANPDFGGQMDVVQMPGYVKLLITYKKKPDDMSDAMITMFDEVEYFKVNEYDAKLTYGRQINFAATKYTIEEVAEKAKMLKQVGY